MERLGFLGSVLEADKISGIPVDSSIDKGLSDCYVRGFSWPLKPVPVEVGVQGELAADSVLTAKHHVMR